MKHILKSLLGAAIFLCASTLSGQEQFDLASLNNQSIFEGSKLESIEKKLKSFESEIDFEDMVLQSNLTSLSITQTDQEIAVLYTRYLLSFGAGLALVDDDTLWCVKAAFLYRLMTRKNTALYGGLGLVYDSLNGTNFSENVLSVQLKALMFIPIIYSLQTQFIYGILGSYGFGNNKFDDGFKTDITRLTVAALAGINVRMTQRWSLMIYTSILSYQEQTLKPESGGEFTSINRWALINKRNLLALSLIYNF